MDRRQVENFVIGVHKDRPVYLRDAATITDGPEETRNYTRIGFGPGNDSGKIQGTSPAVTIALSKKMGTNAVKVAEEVIARAQQLSAKLLPSHARMIVTRNYGETANEKVNELLFEIIVAIVVVVFLIVFSLGWRAAVIVAAAVPIAFALTLFINLVTGYTINRVTLFCTWFYHSVWSWTIR